MSNSNIEVTEITDGAIKGTITTKISFAIRPKQKGHIIASFGGHIDFKENGKNLAEAWLQDKGYRVYMQDDDEIVIDYNSDDAIDYDIFKQIQAIIDDPANDFQSIKNRYIEKLEANRIALEIKNKELREELERKDQLKKAQFVNSRLKQEKEWLERNSWANK